MRWKRLTLENVGTSTIYLEPVESWHGRKDLNPQPTDLESVALPIELHPYTENLNINADSKSLPLANASGDMPVKTTKSEPSPARLLAHVTHVLLFTLLTRTCASGDYPENPAKRKYFSQLREQFTKLNGTATIPASALVQRIKFSNQTLGAASRNYISMRSNWKLIRELVNAAIDSCELAESLDIKDEEWPATMKVKERDVSAWDFLQSSWRYPENLRDCLVRARHGLGEDRKYTDELQRTLTLTGMLAAELVGLEKFSQPVLGVDPYHPDQAQSAQHLVQGLIDFHRQHLIPNLPKLISSFRQGRP